MRPVSLSFLVFLSCANTQKVAGVVVATVDSLRVSIQGTIKSPRGKSVIGAVVAAIRYEDQGNIFAIARTDQFGRYQFVGLRDATYGVTATAHGFAAAYLGEIRADNNISDPDRRKTPPSEVVDWIRSHSVALKTTDPNEALNELTPVGDLIGDAELVALGEATHGTRELFQLKHRLVKFLVAEKGFTLFGLEAPMPEGFDVNARPRRERGKRSAGEALRIQRKPVLVHTQPRPWCRRQALCRSRRLF